jgi:SAM-dependent methyltransferase
MFEIFGLVILIPLLAFFIFSSVAFIIGAPFAPTSSRAMHAMVGLAKITSGLVVYDVGSGDGRLVIEAAKRGAHTIGIEGNPFLVALSRLRIMRLPYRENIRFVWGNFWHYNVTSAKVIFAYLPPRAMDKLRKKLISECNPGTVVITNSHIFSGWEEIGRDTATHTYAFRVPVRKR